MSRTARFKCDLCSDQINADKNPKACLGISPRANTIRVVSPEEAELHICDKCSQIVTDGWTSLKAKA